MIAIRFETGCISPRNCSSLTNQDQDFLLGAVVLPLLLDPLLDEFPEELCVLEGFDGAELLLSELLKTSLSSLPVFRGVFEG